jgi:uncharacterized protein YfaS (alpha-2-macroglobulin family)
MIAIAWPCQAAGALSDNFSVETFTPEGLASPSDYIRIKFSRDVVASADVGRDLDGGKLPITISPELHGHGGWLDQSTLAYGGPMSEATSYSVEVDESLRDINGSSISGRRVFEFHTAPLTFTDARQVNYDAERGFVDYEIYFSLPVNPAEFAKFFRVTDQQEKPVKISFRSSETSPVMSIRLSDDDGSRITMHIEKGLTSERGSLGLVDSVSREMDRDIALKISNSEAQRYYYEEPCILIETTSNVDVTKAAPFIEITPPISTRIEVYGSSLRIYGDFKPRERVTVRVRKGLPALSGPPLGADWLRAFVFPDVEPTLDISSSGHILSHAGDSIVVPITSVNVDDMNVSLRRVYDNNVPFVMLDGWSYYVRDLSEEIFNETFHIDAKPNETAKNAIDLKKILNGRKGLFDLLVKKGDYWPNSQRTINVTDIAGTAKISEGGILAWANSISTGKPLYGVNVKVYSKSNQLLCEGRTNRDGLWEKKLDGGWKENLFPKLAIFSKGDDVAALPFELSVIDSGAYGGEPYVNGGYQTMCFFPRGVFRPGESVPIFVLLRELNFSMKAPFPVQVKIKTPQWRDWKTTTVQLSPMGMGSTVIQLSDAAPTGNWGVEIYIPGEREQLAYGTFLVEDFAPPRIKVDVKSDTKELFGGEDISLALSSEYLFGSPSDGLSYEITETFIPREYSNAKWPGYAFRDARKTFTAESETIAEGTFSEAGEADVKTAIPRLSPPSILDASFQAGVMQNDGRWVYKNLVLPYFPSRYLFGIKLPEGAVYTSTPTPFGFAAIDHEGNPISSDRANLSIFRVVHNKIVTTTSGVRHYESRIEFEPLSGYEGLKVDFENGKAEVEATFPSAGQYLIAIENEESGVSAAVYTYAYNDRWNNSDAQAMLEETLNITLDKDRYSPGDRARVKVSGPNEGTALLTVETNGILHQDVAATKDKSAEFTFKITEDMMPNAWVTVDLVRAVVPEDDWSAHRIFGAAPLNIDCSTRMLSIDITAPEKLMPLESPEFSLVLTDSKGRGIEGEVVLMLVDEGVLNLTRFATPNPFEYFTRRRGLNINQYDVYGYLFPLMKDVPPLLTPGGGAYDENALLNSALLSAVRADRFKILSLSKTVETDRNGKVNFSFDLPEFSGRARLMAVAASKGAFGATERSFTISKNVVMEQSLPRAVAPGDTFESAIILFNRTELSIDVEVEMNIEGPLLSVGVDNPESDERHIREKLELPPSGVRELLMVLRADEDSGVAKIISAAKYSGGETTLTTEVPIRPPFPRITKSDGLLVAPGESRTIALPGGWLQGTRRGLLSLSGLPEVGLMDAVSFLIQYPYSCLEQTVSSAWTLLAQPDLVSSLDPLLANREQLEYALFERIIRIQSMQLYNGGFRSWPGGTIADWNSVYATHFLVVCEKNGIPFQRAMLDSAISYISELVSVVPDSAGTDETYSGGLALRAYASYVISLKGKPPLAWMSYLRDNISSMPRYGRILLAAAYARAGERDIARPLLGDDIPPIIDYKAALNEKPNLDSDLRNQALSLLAWNELDPTSANAANNAARLLDSLRRMEYITTHEAGFALPALAAFFAHNKGEGVAILEASGETGIISETSGDKIATSSIDDKTSSIVVKNTGEGNGYATWVIDGIPTNEATAEDRGIKVRVEYFDANKKILPSPLNLTRGQKVIGKITLEALAGTADNIAISLPMAGGLELENPRLIEGSEEDGGSNSGVRVELRDDRMLIFVGRFYKGFAWEFSMRAVTAGQFTLPPVSAEGMYSPGARSTGATSKVLIKTK